MVTKLSDNYGRSDYAQVPGNKYVCAEKDLTVAENVEGFDLEQVIASQGEFRKFVFGCVANNEALPFKDESFSAYLANLSV